MNFNTMLFLVVTVALVTQMIVKIVGMRQQKPSRSHDYDRVRRLEETMAAMDQRLKNVETIVTAKDYRLREEFEELER